MSHTFELKPDLALLNKHGYDLILPLQVDSIWTEGERVRIEDGFKEILRKHDLSKHYDTLLYVVLYNHAICEQRFQYHDQMFDEHKRVKELAQLLSVFEPQRKQRPNTIKIQTSKDSVKIVNPILIDWIGKLIGDTIEKGDYEPTVLGEAVLNFTSNEEGNIIGGNQKLDFKRVARYATQTIRSGSKRVRNKELANFLLAVLYFIESEMLLVKSTNIRFAANHLRFLFEIAELLEWIRSDDVESNIEDYLSTLLTNSIKE